MLLQSQSLAFSLASRDGWQKTLTRKTYVAFFSFFLFNFCYSSAGGSATFSCNFCNNAISLITSESRVWQENSPGKKIESKRLLSWKFHFSQRRRRKYGIFFPPRISALPFTNLWCNLLVNALVYLCYDQNTHFTLVDYFLVFSPLEAVWFVVITIWMLPFSSQPVFAPLDCA